MRNAIILSVQAVRLFAGFCQAFGNCTGRTVLRIARIDIPWRLYPASKSRICCGFNFHETTPLISLLRTPSCPAAFFVPAEELISQLSASVLFRLPYKRVVRALPARGPLRLKLARRVAPSSLLSGWLVYNDSEPCQSLVGRLVMMFTTPGCP